MSGRLQPQLPPATSRCALRPQRAERPPRLDTGPTAEADRPILIRLELSALVPSATKAKRENPSGCCGSQLWWRR